MRSGGELLLNERPKTSTLGSAAVAELAPDRAGAPGRYLVVLTACIDPSTGRHRVHRSDPAVRLGDYADGLRFWLGLADPRLSRVLFLDNSGYPLDKLAEVAAGDNPHRKQVELISMRCNECPEGVSYGYSELAMLDEGLGRSELAKECTHLIKATGRLRFPKIRRLLDRLPADFEFAVDARDNAWFVRSPQRFVTTQLMIFSRSFYEQHLRGIRDELSPEVPLIENLLFAKLMKYKGKAGAILRWPVSVDPVGRAAHWDKDYGSMKHRVRNLLRGVCRRVAPGWWV
jgi:hypothetical protein